MNHSTSISPPVSGLVSGKKATFQLSVIKILLASLNKYGIIYCHFKSNEHLQAAMMGDSDLDMLFDHNCKETLLSTLNTIGFKKFETIPQKQFTDIEDFIAMDFPSGKVVHLHAHFRLTMGEPYVKSYQLNLQNQLLQTRVFVKDFGIYCSHPVYEFVLLYLRKALEIRNRDILSIYVLRNTRYSDKIMREYAWLKQRTTEEELKICLKGIFDDYLPVYKLMTAPFSTDIIFKLSFLVKKAFKNQRILSPLNALTTRWHREISIKLIRKWKLLSGKPFKLKRINSRGGLIVAVIGADGSGKSTVIANLKSTFNTKLDVYDLYMGRGDGKLSWPVRILFSFKRILIPATKDHGKPESGRSGQRKGFLAELFKCLEALVITNEKANNLKHMVAAKKMGMLVICDRFPQNQLMGYNDGPLLHNLSKARNPIFRLAAKLESKVYETAEKNPPDIVFKLIADPEIIAARKANETPMEKLIMKISGIKCLKFGEGCKVVQIDASQPLEKVLYTIKRKIWLTYS